MRRKWGEHPNDAKGLERVSAALKADSQQSQDMPTSKKYLYGARDRVEEIKRTIEDMRRAELRAMVPQDEALFLIGEIERLRRELWTVAECIFRNVSSDDATRWARGIHVSIRNDEPPSFAVETSDDWRALHRRVSTWSALNSVNTRPDFTALNKILAEHNPFAQKATAFSGTPSSGMGCVVCGRLFFQGRPTCDCNGPQLSQKASGEPTSGSGCPACGVMRVVGARHFSGCPLHPGEAV